MVALKCLKIIKKTFDEPAYLTVTNMSTVPVEYCHYGPNRNGING